MPPLRGLKYWIAPVTWGSRPRLYICRASGAQLHEPLSFDFLSEPQSGEKYLAWGVSPRNRNINKIQSPGGATEKCHGVGPRKIWSLQ